MADILILDNNEELLEMFQYLFTYYQYKICNVNSQLALIRELQKKKPDLILLNLMLSECDGIELCDDLKGNEETMDIPIILIAANLNKLKDFENCKADDIIKKPFNLSALLSKVQLLLESPVF